MEQVSEPCSMDHNKYDLGSVYKSVDNKNYCAKGFYLFEVKCSLCDVEFVKSQKEVNDKVKAVVPSIAKPVMVCNGQVKYSCTHAVCYKCFQKKVNDEISQDENPKKTRRVKK